MSSKPIALPDTSSQPQNAAPNILDPKKIASAVWRRKYLVVLICLVGISGSAYYTSRMTKAYSGTASVMMENPTDPLSIQPSSLRVEAGRAHAVLALSKPVKMRAEEIAEESFAPSATSAIAPQLEARIEEQMLYLNVIDGDPERAAKFANAWADAFVEAMTQRTQAPKLKARDQLDKSLAKAEADLRKVEEEVKAFESTFNKREYEEEQRLVNALDSEFKSNKSKIDKLAAEKDRNDARIAAPLDLTEVGLEPFQRMIADLNVQLLETEELEKPDSARIKGLKKGIERMKTAAKDSIVSASAHLQRDLEFERKEMNRVGRALDDEILKLSVFSAGALRDQELRANADKAHKNLDELKNRKYLLDDRVNYVYSYARPWEQAYANTAAIRPDWKKNLSTAAFASMFAALLVVLGLEFMDQTVKTASDVEGKVSGATIGFVPRLKLSDSGARGLFLAQNSFAADSLRNLQVRLDMIMGVRRSGHASIIVVTSPLPGEGKSFLASNIASFFASSGQNVLLIDGDFRKAMLSASHRCHGKRGLGDALVSGEWNRDVVMKTDVPGCSFLPSGTQGEKGLRHLNPGSMDSLLNKIKPDYDVIVIDTAPVLAMADVCIMAALADVTLLAVRSRRSKFVHVQRASGLLQAARTKSLNVVVNAVEAADAKSEDYYFAVGSYGQERPGEGVKAERDAT